MSPVATSAAEFWGGACPTPKSTSAYTGNYTTNADASGRKSEKIDFRTHMRLPIALLQAVLLSRCDTRQPDINFTVDKIPFGT